MRLLAAISAIIWPLFAAVPNNFGANVGVNIPALVYSTPFTAYDTRLEILYAAPFIHTDGPAANTATANRVDIFQQAIGPIIAHDFGNDFGASLILLLRPPSEHFFNYTYADLRASFSYTGNGLDITATFGYTGTFGGQQGGTAFGIQRNPFTGNVITAGNSDAVDLDFTATKKFGKFEIGFVGFAQTDINTRGVNSIVLADGTLVSKRQGAVAVGGLLGYDFGRFTLQGYATREVASRNQGGEETKGFLRLIVPLYVAPAPVTSMVRARY